MEGATRKGEHMSKEETIAWRDLVLEKFEANLGTELPSRFSSRFPGPENILSLYSGVIEEASKDVWRELFFVAREPASRMAPSAESAAKELEKCYSEIVGYAVDSINSGDIRVLEANGYQTLIKAGEVVAHVREASEPYKVGKKPTEPESVTTYVEMLLRAQKKMHPVA